MSNERGETPKLNCMHCGCSLAFSGKRGSNEYRVARCAYCLPRRVTLVRALRAWWQDLWRTKIESREDARREAEDE